METRARYILVGAFTIVALFAAVFFTLWMAKAGADRGYTDYDVVFNDPVSGLSVGSPVLFNGIRVGEVSTLALDPDDSSRVRARISVESTTPITTDTTARTALLNVTGATGVDLQQGSSDGTLLKTSTDIPVIIAEPSPFTRLRVSSEELLVNLTTFLNNASRLVSDENMERIASILENMDTFSGQLVGYGDSFESLLADIQQTSNTLNQTLQTIDEQVLTQGAPIMEEASATMHRISSLSETLERILADNEQAIDSGLASANEIGPAIRELRNTLATLNSIVTEIDQEPASYFLQRETMKEF